MHDVNAEVTTIFADDDGPVVSSGECKLDRPTIYCHSPLFLDVLVYSLVGRNMCVVNAEKDSLL